MKDEKRLEIIQRVFRGELDDGRGGLGSRSLRAAVLPDQGVKEVIH